MKNKYTLRMIINSQDYAKISSIFLFKYFFIPMAWPITWILANMGLSPNQATLLRLIIFIIAYFFIIFGLDLTGYILIYIGLIADCVDGQIARLLNKASYFGKFIDGWIDCIFEITFPLIVAVGCYKLNNDINILLYGMLAALMNALYWITLLRYSINKPYMKNHKFPILISYILKYIDDRLLIDWFDLKYFFFPIFFFFNATEIFVEMLAVINTILFFIYGIQRLYKGYYVLKVHKKSASHKV